MDKITKFYKSHPESREKSIIDVWQEVTNRPKSGSDRGTGGEIWTNPHWYLNGDWWSQLNEDEQLGFVEGYLFCLKTQINDSTERYSLPANSYRRKIDTFVKANPRRGKEAVAVTLRRFSDPVRNLN